jgi:hypothetical protein
MGSVNNIFVAMPEVKEEEEIKRKLAMITRQWRQHQQGERQKFQFALVVVESATSAVVEQAVATGSSSKSKNIFDCNWKSHVIFHQSKNRNNN